MEPLGSTKLGSRIAQSKSSSHRSGACDPSSHEQRPSPKCLVETYLYRVKPCFRVSSFMVRICYYPPKRGRV